MVLGALCVKGLVPLTPLIVQTTHFMLNFSHYSIWGSCFGLCGLFLVLLAVWSLVEAGPCGGDIIPQPGRVQMCPNSPHQIQVRLVCAFFHLFGLGRGGVLASRIYRQFSSVFHFERCNVTMQPLSNEQTQSHTHTQSIYMFCKSVFLMHFYTHIHRERKRRF